MNLMVLIKSEEELKDDNFLSSFDCDKNLLHSIFQVAKDPPVINESFWTRLVLDCARYV